MSFIQEFPQKERKENKKLIEKCTDNEKIFEKTKINNYTWLEDIFLENKDKSKYITIRELCKKINQDKLYEDYRDLSNYVHGQNHYIKTMAFTFYESINCKVMMFIDIIVDCVELISNEFIGCEHLLERIYNKKNKIYKKIQNKCFRD